jgi:hypothetical protein
MADNCKIRKLNAKLRKVLAVQTGIRFPKWMHDAIEEIAEKGGHTFTDVVIDLL